MLRRAPAAFLCLVSIACWKEQYAALPSGVLPFRPSAGGPEGWNVAALTLPLTCPDEQPAQLFVLSPADASTADPLPVALLLHSGSFDYVIAPLAGPDAVYLEGTHFAEPSRLTGAWAANQVYTMLGMRPGDDPESPEQHDGSLPAALVAAGIAVVMPANCWGDLWADQATQQSNDFASDFFVRDGRTSAEWAYSSLLDPAFADALDIVWPFTPDPAETYLIGLGEGGRGVAELLSAVDENGDRLYQPDGVAVDSSPDDLRVFYADPGVYADVVEGLTRIFFDPAGPEAADAGSMWSAPLAPKTAYFYSSADPTWPSVLQDAAVSRLDAGTPWVLDAGQELHVLSNGNVPGLGADLVTYLTTGTIPSR